MSIDLFFNKKTDINTEPINKNVVNVKQTIIDDDEPVTVNVDVSMKKIITNDIKKMSSMTVQEHTLYEKWFELNELKTSKNDLLKIQEVKNNIWIPYNYEDFMSLEPDVIVANEKEQAQVWTILRRFTSTMKWSQSPGRFGKFLVVDKITGKYLGVISIASDFISIGGRDKYIEWQKNDKMDNGRLRHTCMASSLVPTQPLGYNYTGGKLISLLSISDVIENFWNTRYNDKLCGVTTTSLYGEKGLSQYTGLKYWHECEFSNGKIPIEPSEETYDKIREWAKENHKEYYDNLMKSKKNGTPASHPRPRLINFTFSKFGIKPINNNFVRGVYFSELYDNTKEFLCSKDNELKNKKFDNSVKTLSDLWKKKYASKRIKKLVNENKCNKNILFYDDLIGITFDETKEKYLKDVGR